MFAKKKKFKKKFDGLFFSRAFSSFSSEKVRK